MPKIKFTLELVAEVTPKQAEFYKNSAQHSGDIFEALISNDDASLNVVDVPDDTKADVNWAKYAGPDE